MRRRRNWSSVFAAWLRYAVCALVIFRAGWVMACSPPPPPVLEKLPDGRSIARAEEQDYAFVGEIVGYVPGDQHLLASALKLKVIQSLSRKAELGKELTISFSTPELNPGESRELPQCPRGIAELLSVDNYPIGTMLRIVTSGLEIPSAHREHRVIWIEIGAGKPRAQ